jgi:hypothetical protein
MHMARGDACTAESLWERLFLFCSRFACCNRLRPSGQCFRGKAGSTGMVLYRQGANSPLLERPVVRTTGWEKDPRRQEVIKRICKMVNGALQCMSDGANFPVGVCD